MKPARNAEPRLLRHPRTGRAFIFVRDADGKRRQLSLGADWGTPEAQRRYHQELARWHEAQRAGPVAAAVADVDVDAHVTVADAAARWLLHCEKYYRRPDGSPTSETSNCTHNIGPLIAMLGDERLASITPKKLKAVRERMIHGDPALPAENGAVGAGRWQTRRSAASAAS